MASAGGRMARELSKNPTVLIVNDTIFAHGGVMPVSCPKPSSLAGCSPYVISALSKKRFASTPT